MVKLCCSGAGWLWRENWEITTKEEKMDTGQPGTLPTAECQKQLPCSATSYKGQKCPTLSTQQPPSPNPKPVSTFITCSFSCKTAILAKVFAENTWHTFYFPCQYQKLASFSTPTFSPCRTFHHIERVNSKWERKERDPELCAGLLLAAWIAPHTGAQVLYSGLRKSKHAWESQIQKKGQEGDCNLCKSQEYSDAWRMEYS